jgi:anaerobic magnesium-protoporphyrin IX monomethyl ester cyclase
MLFIVPNLNWIDDDVNALWDLFPWNLCLLAAMIEDVCDVVILDAYQENYSEI